MTEEEAIETLKSPLLKEDGYERHQTAIDTLLELYNKQKEEIEELKENKDTICISSRQYGKTYGITKEYISKDKIKNTLLKFQNEYGEWLEITGRLFIGKEVVQYGEDMLDEIAKELDIKLLEVE